MKPTTFVRGERLLPVLTLSLLLLAVGAAVAQAEGPDYELYHRARQQFLDHDYQQALELLARLRSEYPDSRKSDDALWYMGRIYARLGRTAEAAEAFTRILSLPSTNRRPEAAYELGRIYYHERDYQRVVDLLEPLKKREGLDQEDEKLLLLLAKSWYNLGILAKNGKENAAARGGFLKAVDTYRILTATRVDQRSLADAEAGLGKSYTKLADLAADRAEYQACREQALSWLEKAISAADPKDAGKLQDLRKGLQARKAPDFQADGQLLGGTDTLAFRPALRASAGAALGFELGAQHRLEARLDVDHDGMTLKTFNFTAANRLAGDMRLLQRTDTVDAALIWRAGRTTPLRSRLALDGTFRLAQDPEDTYLGAGLREALSLGLGDSWKAGLEAAFDWKSYPNYLVNGRQLDHVQIGAGPALKWTFLPDWRARLTYDYSLKQYLNAHYDTASGAPSDRNRQYQTHTAELGLRGKAWGILEPSLSYAFTFNKSYNYDVWVTDSSGSSQFVTGYFDYLQHELFVGTGFDWPPGLHTELRGSAALRGFLTYPARDAADTFTGELRRDIDLRARARTSWLFWPRQRNGAGDLSLVVDLSFEQALSNMLYERYFDTNYTSFAAFGGLSFAFR